MNLKILHPLPDKLPKNTRKALIRKELITLTDKLKPDMERELKYVEEYKKAHILDILSQIYRQDL